MGIHDHIKVVAHRGASGLCGQANTLVAFELAIRLGCDMVELDVRCTGDGQLVCFHDAAVGSSRLVDLSLDELRACSGVDVPTFAQAVRLCSAQIGMNVEIKAAGYEREVIQTLKSDFGEGDYDIECFNVEVVAELGRIDQTISRGLLASRNPDLSESDMLDAIAAASVECGADFLSLDHLLLSDSLFDHPVLGKLPVYCWTVDDADRMRELVQYPITAIVTNRPDYALSVVGRSPE